MMPLYRLALLACLGVVAGCAQETTLIRSAPSEARVFIDGKLAGLTPLQVQLTKESHRIRLEKEGYAPLIDHLSVVPQDPGLLLLARYPVWGVVGSDAKYTFKPAYDFKLQPMAGGATTGEATTKPRPPA